MSVDDEVNSELYKNLLEQVFALSYYAHIDAAYVTSLTTEERHYLLKYLKEVKEREEKEIEKMTRQTKEKISPTLKLKPRFKP